MPVENYGVLKGTVIRTERDPENDSKPHLHIYIAGENNKEYDCAVNVRSKDQSEVLYYADSDFDAEQITILPTIPNGYKRINENSSNHEIALDYVRGNLFDSTKMVPLPHTAPERNDLYEFLEEHTLKAINNNATIYVYGSKFPRGMGMHNVHMNQGNDPDGDHGDENGTWNDGGILIQFENHWVAIFLAFQTQSWCTNTNGFPDPNNFCPYSEPNKDYE
ncbi:YukJ family protein [Bacillus inaquosorum]|uniref:YukJ family protein n=3 Tax=Bacillus inaquosorum TaxID=483913 RepID=UPI002280ECEB|nr:YukJ family protein [Bacillus inaquosorum]MCY7980435.1 YukJ family protein [Bacillus inaquosorum]MCY8053937.1 YukJ family protein [Bacillus inaquosorum]MCY8282070.1 YukJ family protein [Bacillus inaquosorum]MCY8753507.1 YukJ family protein [Bacillus inaquosorum]MCY9343496.1 YukJ family protein [Bacillus inaquosorum]